MHSVLPSDLSIIIIWQHKSKEMLLCTLAGSIKARWGNKKLIHCLTARPVWPEVSNKWPGLPKRTFPLRFNDRTPLTSRLSNHWRFQRFENQVFLTSKTSTSPETLGSCTANDEICVGLSAITRTFDVIGILTGWQYIGHACASLAAEGHFPYNAITSRRPMQSAYQRGEQPQLCSSFRQDQYCCHGRICSLLFIGHLLQCPDWMQPYRDETLYKSWTVERAERLHKTLRKMT